jgi:hypothetical protein
MLYSYVLCLYLFSPPASLYVGKMFSWLQSNFVLNHLTTHTKHIRLNTSGFFHDYSVNPLSLLFVCAIPTLTRKQFYSSVWYFPPDLFTVPGCF